MYARCNTTNSSLAAESLAVLSAAPAGTWDDLLSQYADIVIAGTSHCQRHSSRDYHRNWLRYYGLLYDRARVLGAAGRP